MFCFLCVYFTKKQWCKFISEEALEFIFSTAKVKLHFSCINHNKQMLKYCWNPAELVIFKLWIELVDEREDQKVSFYGNWSDELVSLVKCAKHSRQRFHSCHSASSSKQLNLLLVGMFKKSWKMEEETFCPDAQSSDGVKIRIRKPGSRYPDRFLEPEGVRSYGYEC